MQANSSTLPNTHIRRQQRAVHNENWIKAFLKRAPFGVLAMAVDNQPYAKNILFAYDESEHAIYIHGAVRGRTPETLRANPRVCFTVAEMGRLLPAAEASEVSVEYASVVIFGLARILEDEPGMIYGLQRLMDKYFPHLKPGQDYSPLDGKQIAGTAVYRIEIQGWSGKSKQVEDDFPEAFFYTAG